MTAYLVIMYVVRPLISRAFDVPKFDNDFEDDIEKDVEEEPENPIDKKNRIEMECCQHKTYINSLKSISPSYRHHLYYDRYYFY